MIQIWIIFALISAFFTGLKEVFTKDVFKKKSTVVQVIFVEYFYLILILLVFFRNFIDFFAIFSLYKLFVVKCFTLFCFTYFYFSFLKKYEISKISPLLNLSPIFLLFLSSCFLNETITFLQFLGICIIIVSTFFLEFDRHNNDHYLLKFNKKSFKIILSKIKEFKNFNFKTIGCVILMLFLISITAITDKMIFQNLPSVSTNLFFTSFILIFFVHFYLFFSKKVISTYKVLINKELILISFLTNISTFFVLEALSNSLALTSLVVPIKRCSTLFSSIIGGFFFKEKNILKKVVLICFMIFGIFLIAF